MKESLEVSHRCRRGNFIDNCIVCIQMYLCWEDDRSYNDYKNVKQEHFVIIRTFLWNYQKTLHTVVSHLNFFRLKFSANHLLDSIGEDDETYEDAYCPIQVPHLGFMLEHFSTDEDGESHDPPDQWVESWKEKVLYKDSWRGFWRLLVGIQTTSCLGLPQTPVKSPVDMWYWLQWPLTVKWYIQCLVAWRILEMPQTSVI